MRIFTIQIQRILSDWKPSPTPSVHSATAPTPSPNRPSWRSSTSLILFPPIQASQTEFEGRVQHKFFPPYLFSRTVPDNEWTHLATAWDRDAAKLSMYVNGELTKTAQGGSVSLDLKKNDHAAYEIGLLRGDGTTFHGSIKELIIFDRALDEEEVKVVRGTVLYIPARTKRDPLCETHVRVACVASGFFFSKTGSEWQNSDVGGGAGSSPHPIPRIAILSLAPSLPEKKTSATQATLRIACTESVSRRYNTSIPRRTVPIYMFFSFRPNDIHLRNTYFCVTNGQTQCL